MMDDLNGLDWSSKPAPTGPKQANYSSSAFSSLNLKPTPPTSGRASPFQPPSTGTTPGPASKAATPANDSFSNLVSFNGSNANKNLSLQEQQKRLADLKLQQLVNQKQSLQDAWAGNDDAWNNLGSGRSTPGLQSNSTAKKAPRTAAEEEDDLFAAFNNNSANVSSGTAKQPLGVDDDDDDPFGLAQLKNKPAAAHQQWPGPPVNNDDDDDILGDLGRPVSARPPQKIERQPSPPPPVSDHPQEKAVAEMVDMGFTADKARYALERTESGVDVQAAVGLLLNQAHEEARQKSRPREQSAHDQDDMRARPQQSRSRPPPGRDQEREVAGRSSNLADDSAKAASEMGAAFMKSAGAFWKQAQKTVQKAVEDFGSDSDSAQPKWMRETAEPPRSQPQDRQVRPRRRNSEAKKQTADVTDEAMMLESQRPTPAPRPKQPPRPRADPMFDSSANSSRDHSPAMPSRLRESASPQPAFMRQQQQQIRPQSQVPSSKSSLSRQAADAQASEAYVSSARRRKAGPVSPPVTAEDDFLNGMPAPSKAPPPQSIPTSQSAPPITRPKPAVAPSPIPVRPAAPPRNIPPVSALSMKASHTARLQGNVHYKRGDFASAHTSYNSALSHLPKTHPLTLPLLANVALTSIKIGSAKDAVTYTNTALELIGPSKGESETVVFTDSPENEPPKPMRDYYGKALMRKAEALEVLEKWSEAALVWKICVEDGHGGATAIQARTRAEKAAQPKPAPVAKKPAVRPPPKPARLAVSAQSSAAVSALRAANAAAEKADDEKFRLSDAVDARIASWRGGREGNLRALLTSLDGVLWEGAGWKKISMADVVLPGKVKVIYMKGIAKVHPDKIPSDATTEQRMVAGAVFSTLNEAWDKFKAENNL